MAKIKSYDPFADLPFQIKVQAMRRNLNMETICKRTFIKKGTMYNRLKRPGDFELWELYRIAQVLGVKIETLLQRSAQAGEPEAGAAR